MKTFTHTQTLFYYDGPQVIEGRDLIGGHYIGIMVEPDGDMDRYLVAGVVPESLRRFRAGEMDLRSLIEEHGPEEWYLATAEGGMLDQPLELRSQAGALEASGFLPDPGFLLHNHASADETVREARSRNNVILNVAVEPPEAVTEHRIRLDTLAALLAHIQTIVKHAYAAALRELAPITRKQIDRSDSHLLDVIVPAAVGSFRVTMEASKMPDMLGVCEIERALDRIDVLFANADNPQAVLETIKAHKGHLAGAYLRLLRFLIEHKTGISYSWAAPNFSTPKGSRVSETEISALVEVLSGISNLGAEPVSLVGKLEKADVVNDTWRLATEDGSFSGKVKEGGPSLNGLKIGGIYKFSCIEEIEFTEGTGREQRLVYLVEHEPV